MQVPKKLLEKWKVLRSPGDADKIVDVLAASGYAVSDETVNRAIRSGSCSDEVFQAIAKFYEQKSKLIKEYL